MPAFTSISRASVCAWLILFSLQTAQAGDANGRTLQPEEADFSNTPFTEYGEFNEEKDEEADTRFLQYGRFFGTSVGLGYETVTGNRGLLWQGGFPMIDLKLHYWLDFNFAINLGFYFAHHQYLAAEADGGQVNVNMAHVGVDLKYYFDTQNLSASISFASPFLILGVGSYTKTETTLSQESVDPDTALGLSLGAGLEFTIRPKKVYLLLEGKYHLPTFKDSQSTQFESSNGIADLTGNFVTVTGSILFTW
jgi:hypothetical protein